MSIVEAVICKLHPRIRKADRAIRLAEERHEEVEMLLREAAGCCNIERPGKGNATDDKGASRHGEQVPRFEGRG